jgi:hypothetical protein
LHDIARDLAQAARDRVPVAGFEREDPQDEQVEGALREVGLGRRR